MLYMGKARIFAHIYIYTKDIYNNLHYVIITNIHTGSNMFRYFTLFSILIIFIIACTSPFGSGGIKFSSRAGTYENTDKTIVVTINDKDKDNLILKVTKNDNIDETLSVSPYTTTTYLSINSEQKKGYIYKLNLGNHINNIFISIKNDKNENFIYNEKLSIVK